jgi:arabinose operon protein AraL
MMRPTHLYDGYIFDLDGTIYLGDALLPTVYDTLTRIKQSGRRIVFLSNNPTRTRTDYANKLTRLGLPTPPGDVINSTVVMVDYLLSNMPDARLFVVGEEPLCDELRKAGFRIIEEADEIDVVIASFDRTFVYRKLQIAFDAIRNGARFFATNSDRFCPVPGGGEPDAASIIAAIEACTNHPLELMVGKPSQYMIDTIMKLINLPPGQCLVAGDRVETEVYMGLNAGMDAALVLTGATDVVMLAASKIQPTYVISQLSELIPDGVGL